LPNFDPKFNQILLKIAPNNVLDLYIKNPQLIAAPPKNPDLSNVFKPKNFNQNPTTIKNLAHNHQNSRSTRKNTGQFTFGKGKKVTFRKSLAYQMQKGGKSLRDYFDLSSMRSESEGNTSAMKSRDKTKATSGHQSTRSKKFLNFMNKIGKSGPENIDPNTGKTR
jgi:hypothetical protein